MDGGVGVAGAEGAAWQLEGGTLVGQGERRRTDGVGREPVLIESDRDFLALLSVDSGGGQGRDAPEHLAEAVGVFLHFTVALVFGTQGYEGGGHRGEVVEYHQSQHSRRKGGLGFVELELYFGPYPVLVPGRGVEVHKKVTNPILGADFQGFAIDLLEAEKNLLKRLRHLLFDLGGAGSRVHRCHQALLDFEGREFVLVDLEDAEDAHSNQHRRHKENQILMLLHFLFANCRVADCCVANCRATERHRLYFHT